MLRAPLLLLLLGSLFVSAIALGQMQLGIMPLSAVKPGMKGYGLSVFRGETPERFEVEIIDVLHNFRPDQDLILARTTHPVLATAITVGGMSGSPIYIDGKMIGAYAYGWPFGKEPVAGVTPIEKMLSEIGRPVDPRIWKALNTLPTSMSASLAPSASNKLRRMSTSDRPRAELSDDVHQDAFAALRAHAAQLGLDERKSESRSALVPASTPLMLSGMSDNAMEALGEQLERFGIVPMQGGGSATAETIKAKQPSAHFVDGGSVGVQLMRGDINATAIGTVTRVEGDRLVAFGHPMLNAGQVGLATCTARVLHVLASEQRSFKIAEAIAPLGTLIHDRQSAIVIDQKLKADMIPMRIRIRGVAGAPRSEWNMEIANQRLLTPSLAFSALLSAMSATAADHTDTVFKLKSRVAIDGHGTVETEDMGYTGGGPSDGQALSRARLFNVLGATYGNPFEDARIAGIELEVDVRYEHDLVHIVDAMVASDDVDPGKDVNVYVTLRAFDSQEETRIIPVRIPQSAAGDSVELSFEAGDDVQLDQPKANSLNDMLDAVRAGYPGTSLVVSTRLPSQGVKLRGQIVRGLPGSALDSLQTTNESERPSTFPSYERKEIPFGHVLTGSARIKLNVRQEPRR